MAALDQLHALELEKRQLSPGDPRLLEMASQVEDLAAEVLGTAQVQSQLVETTHVMALIDDPQAPSGPIDPGARSLHDILDEWRAAERAVAGAEPASGTAAEAMDRAQRLRQEYQRAFQARERED